MPAFRLTRQDTGAPYTTALADGLAFVAYRDRGNVARAQPTITHLGGGIYSFTCPAADVTDGIGFLLNCGSNANPPKASGFVGVNHVFFAAYDADGNFKTGLTPTITTYVKADGSAATPVPTPAELALGLYVFTPSTQDRVDGVRYAIDLGADAEPNRYPGGNLGDGFVVPSGPVATEPIDFSSDAGNAAPQRRDLKFDFQTLTFVRTNGRFTWTADREAIAQAITIHLTTFLGEWFLDVENGVPYLQEILVKGAVPSTVVATLRREIEKVPGVKSVKEITPTFDSSIRRLIVDYIADSDLGEITGQARLPV